MTADSRPAHPTDRVTPIPPQDDAARDRRLLRIQAMSGAVFLVFVLVHLGNTTAAAAGFAAYSGWLESARRIYQYPVVEIGGLVVPLFVHWSAAVMRLRRDGFRRRNRSLRARLHRYTGYYLLVFIWGHFLATRGPSLFAGIEIGFSTITYTFAWLPYWFYPYYVGLALSGLYHGVNGALLAASIFGARVPRGLRYGPGFWLPFGAAATMVLLGVAGLAGLLYDVPDPWTSEYARWMADFMGGGE